MVLSKGSPAAPEPASKSLTSEHSSVPSLETEMGMDVWMRKKAGSWQQISQLRRPNTHTWNNQAATKQKLMKTSQGHNSGSKADQLFDMDWASLPSSSSSGNEGWAAGLQRPFWPSNSVSPTLHRAEQ